MTTRDDIRVEPEEWVTLYRVFHLRLGRWLLIQKRDGSTRTIFEAAFYSAAYGEG